MKPPDLSWPDYVRYGIGNRLSRWGERLNIHWLTYNPLRFRAFHEEALRNAPAVIAAIRAVFPNAQRVLDVGAGSGAYAAEAIRQGLETLACEHSSHGRRMARRQGVDCRPFDLTREPPADLAGRFDLVWCFEVAEHLPPALGDRLVAFLASQAPVVVFTAAHPGQGGTGHINEQPRGYWIERFSSQGMHLDAAASQALAEGFLARGAKAKWLSENVLVAVTAGDTGRQGQSLERRRGDC